jgi:alpha-ketoglutarate-dependent taurine dioxygenase
VKKFGGIATGLNLGNLGCIVKGVTAQQVFQDPEFFQKIFRRNKAIVFMGMHPTRSEHSQLVKCLHEGIYDPSYTDGLLEDQNHPTIYDVEGEEIPLDRFVRNQWHIDNCFFERVPDMISLHMKTFKVVDHTKGKTYLASLINMYRDCPEHLKEHLRNAAFVGETGSAGRSVIAHSALRTHPDTEETALYWTGEGTHLEAEDGDETPWFVELREYVRSYLANPNNQFSWKWTEGDVMVWDNRAVIHSFGNGWQREDRIFDRIELGYGVPFFDPSKETSQQIGWGDLGHSEGQGQNEIGVNPDHIPLVFTKGISALEGLEHLFQKVSVFAFCDENALVKPQNLDQALSVINAEDLNDVVVTLVDVSRETNVFMHLKRYSDSMLSEHSLAGQVLLFAKNGDLHGIYPPNADLRGGADLDPGEISFVEKLNALIAWHPDLRHAGHAWHYPDWFKHQPLKFRPWSYHHLKFMEYHDLKGEEPTEDFLVQFAIDSIYGCFNHLKNDADRERVVWRIKDYLDYMLDLGECSNER